MSKEKNVFISHHHKDDNSINDLKGLLSKNGYEIKNSSIRVDQDGDSSDNGKKLSDSTIENKLRDKISWAGNVIVIVGEKTHTRDWVNWEIEQAHKQGKNIIGVYENGLKDIVEIPEALEKYANAMHGWNSSGIIDALNGKGNFENPDGTPASRKDGGNSIC